MKQQGINELRKKTIDLKKKVLKMIYEAQSGHPGGALSSADFTAVCYFHEMKYDPKNPKWEDRDRFILSKGHVCPVQYAALATVGFFDVSELDTLRKEGSKLQGHPDMKKCPGIDISTGSLGQGLACGVGMAIAAKRDKKDYRVFVVIGDGETQEGEIWEAANTAHKYELDNLIAFVDVNNLQLDGITDEVMPNGDLGEKFKAFGWDVYEVNGNDIAAIVKTFDQIRMTKTKRPKCILGHTVKGNTVSYMENKANWHGVAPNEEEYKLAIQELDDLLATID